MLMGALKWVMLMGALKWIMLMGVLRVMINNLLAEITHFHPYIFRQFPLWSPILFLPLLVSILKNASCFDHCRYIRDGKCTRGKWQN